MKVGWLFLAALAAGCVPERPAGAPPAGGEGGAVFEARSVRLQRYRAGRLVLSAQIERLRADDLGGTWRAEGVQVKWEAERK